VALGVKVDHDGMLTSLVGRTHGADAGPIGNSKLIAHPEPDSGLLAFSNVDKVLAARRLTWLECDPQRPVPPRIFLDCQICVGNARRRSRARDGR